MSAEVPVSATSHARDGALNPIALLRGDVETRLAGIEGLSVQRSGAWSFALLPMSADDVARLTRAREEPPHWLAGLLQRHHVAVEQVAARVPCYPFPFGVVVPGLAELAASAELQRDALERYFVDVADADEWSFRLHVPKPAVVSAQPERPVSGIEWLRRRAQPADAAPSERDALLGIVAAHARATQARTDEQRDGGGAEYVLIALVARDRSAALLEAVDAWSAQLPEGSTLRRTGPWAPYSFRPRLGDAPSSI